MADIQTLKDRIRSTIYPNGKGAINAADHQALLLEMANKMAEDEAKLTQVLADNERLNKDNEILKEKVQENEVLIEDLQNTKIDKEADDYYPQLSVGVADNLAGVDKVARVINFGQSGGGAITDGVARVQSIKGNSVVWNQSVDNTLDTSLLKFRASSGASLSIEDNAFKLTISGTGSQYAYYRTEPFIAHLVAGHKYCVAVEVKASAARTCAVAISGASGVAINRSLASNVWTRLDVIATISAVSSSTPYLSIGFTAAASGDLLYFKNVQVIDLTLMFGEGNEPATIAELHLPSGVDMSAYNEGEVISMKATGIKSVGRNQWNEQWESGTIDSNTGVETSNSSTIRPKNFIKVIPSCDYYIASPVNEWVLFYDEKKVFVDKYWAGSVKKFTTPANCHYLKFRLTSSYGTTYKNDICINLSDTDFNGQYEPYIEDSEDLSIVAKYFPNGMRSVGSAQDEIRYNKATNKWERVVRIGEVDMGTLAWDYVGASDSTYSMMTDALKTIAKTSSANNVVGNILCSKFITDSAEDVYNRKMPESIAIAPTGRITIFASGYTSIDSVAAFKAAMSGVMLYYELAEPIVTEIEEKDFNLDYKVWNCGAEQMLATDPSAPLAADITYGFNAVGLIKQLRTLVEAMQAKLASL